jgi:tetratricopeptide (TPR) repeat protein
MRSINCRLVTVLAALVMAVFMIPGASAQCGFNKNFKPAAWHPQIGSVLYFARHYDEALAHLDQAEEMEPGKLNFVEGWKSEIYEMKGMRDKAVASELIAISVGDPATARRLDAIYKREGWNGYWETRMKMMLADNDLCAPYDIGVNYIRLGKPELAIPYFDQAIDRKCWEANWMMVDPRVDGIRSDARYNNLLKRMNLPY